ncbi:MAG TPA: COX15/CtaA family protein [Vicinamibacterales bacterium]|nr:COX15/CtaA family protein [Vicinamibacterales bacterium]
MARLARFARAVLLYNVAVVAWGAYVRATGSGAGCGAHWPLCNGEVVLRAPAVETLIEFSHRATSGLALIAVVALFFWARRRTTPGHPLRLGAGLSLAFMISEAALGAGLVLFQLVAQDASTARAFAVGAHLLNTFLLLGALTLSVYWASGGRPLRLGPSGRRALPLAAGGLALLLVSVAGAITALGDTLFPSATLAQGLGADLSATSHLFIRLRTIHPILAVMVALYLLTSVWKLADRRPTGVRFARLVTWLIAVQLGAGVLNVLLLAPVWLQLVHLLVADGVWIAYVFLAADTLAVPAPVVAARIAS